MLELRNHTPFQSALVPWLDPSGVDHVCVVIKGTFSLPKSAGEPRIADEQVPVLRVDEFHGKPAESSIHHAADTAPLKPGTDVVLLGHAHAPPGGRCRSMDVMLRVGPLRKSVRVFGNRAWFRSLMSWQMTPPEPFERMPLVYERAFGGQDDTAAQGPAVELRNPVGTGFTPSGNAKRLEGLALPNLEDPRDLISSPRHRPAPAGFGFIDAHWLPRRARGGTYDEAWRKERCPFLPDDFDMRFFNSAPAELVSASHLKGGEPVEVSGANPQGKLAFLLPSPRLRARAWLREQALDMEPVLDTVVIEPEHARVVLTWKAMLRCGQQVLHLSRVALQFEEGMA